MKTVHTLKRIACALAALALAALLALPAFAAGKPLVVDDLGKISETSLANLNSLARRISDKYQVDVGFFLTSGTYAPGQTLSEYTRERWPDIQNGIVLAHDVDGKLLSVTRFGNAEEFVTDKAMATLRKAYDEEDTYSGGVKAYLRAADKFLAKTFPSEGGPTPDAPQVLRDPSEVSLLMDEAKLLTKSEANELKEKLYALSKQWKNDIVIVTVDSLDGNTPEEFADDWFDYNGYGQATSGDITDGDGLLLLISMEERDWRISTKGYAIEVFTDAGIEFLGERLKADGLSDGDYASAFNGFADWCDKFYTQAETGKPYDRGNLPKVPKTGADYAKAVFWGFAGGAVIALIVTGSMKKKLKTVRIKAAAADYVRPGSLQVAYANEQFLFRNVTRVYNPPSSSGGGGGGSSSHSSSSGSSHGGGGGKF